MAEINDKTLVESAVTVWASVDLPTLQASLDERGATIQEYQKESLLGRKELATKTKAFKTLEDEEKLNQFNPLLKSYQNEIDILNKRNKYLENTFFKVYRALAEAPDPKPLLQNALKDSQSQSQLQKLKDENSNLSNQLLKFADYNTLKDKIVQTEKDMERLYETKMKALEDKWNSILEERENNWSKNELKFQTTINDLKSQLEESSINEKMLKRKLKNNELVFDDEEIEEVASADDLKEDDSIQVNLLKKDLESAKSRITFLENRNEELRKDISSAKSKADLDIQNFKQSQRNQHSDLEGENALLAANLDHERKNIEKLKTEIKELKSNSESEHNQLTKEIDNLLIIKNKTSDYQDIKKELEILKQIQFGDEDEDEDDIEDEDEDEETAKNFKRDGGIDSIESAIVQRNRKLNDDLVELRNKNEQLSRDLEASKKEILDLNAHLKTLQDANSRLETDLLNFDGANSRGNDKWETMSMISSVAPSIYPGSKANISPAASIAGGFNDTASIATLGGGNAGSQQDSSLLPIITQQRDRFRSRNRELEDENKKHFSKIMEMKREVNSLKADNKELFEKIQFLKFHNNNAKVNTNKNISGNTSSGSSVDDRYAQDYERQLHPIERFRIMETERISSKISPWERIFIQVTKTILSTPYTRWLFAGYCISLHLVVMLLTLTLVGSTPEPIVSQSTLTGSTGGKAALG